MSNILQVETIETDSIVKLLYRIVTPYTTEILQYLSTMVTLQVGLQRY